MCILLVRTDPDAPKHKGISYIMVDMHSPGVTVRPLVQITGDEGFNEVFFEDVRVPKKNMVGEKNQGWQVAITTLMFERSAVAATRGMNTARCGSWRSWRKSLPRNGRRRGKTRSVRQRIARVRVRGGRRCATPDIASSRGGSRGCRRGRRAR